MQDFFWVYFRTNELRPAYEIYSTYSSSNNAYYLDEGTSLAVPYVTGSLALVLAKYAAETHQQTISRLLNAADPLPALSGKCLTGGRLNLHNALGAPIRLMPILPLNDGQFRLQLSGDANRTYIIQVTTNFAYWSPVFTNTTGTNSIFEFTDTLAGSRSQQFYRAVSSP